MTQHVSIAIISNLSLEVACYYSYFIVLFMLLKLFYLFIYFLYFFISVIYRRQVYMCEVEVKRFSFQLNDKQSVIKGRKSHQQFGSFFWQ